MVNTYDFACCVSIYAYLLNFISCFACVWRKRVCRVEQTASLGNRILLADVPAPIEFECVVSGDVCREVGIEPRRHTGGYDCQVGWRCLGNRLAGAFKANAIGGGRGSEPLPSCAGRNVAFRRGGHWFHGRRGREQTVHYLTGLSSCLDGVAN